MTKGNESKIPRKAARIQIKIHNCAFILLAEATQHLIARTALTSCPGYSWLCRHKRGGFFMWETSSALFSKHHGNRKITRPSREVAKWEWEPAEPQTHECVNEGPEHPIKGISSSASNSNRDSKSKSKDSPGAADKTSDSGMSEQQKDGS